MTTDDIAALVDLFCATGVDVMAADIVAPRPKILGGLTPSEDTSKVWTAGPDRFTLDPIHRMPGLNS